MKTFCQCGAKRRTIRLICRITVTKHGLRSADIFLWSCESRLPSLWSALIVLYCTLGTRLFNALSLFYNFISNQFDRTFGQKRHENGTKLVKMLCEWLFFWQCCEEAQTPKENRSFSSPEPPAPFHPRELGTRSEKVPPTPTKPSN